MPISFGHRVPALFLFCKQSRFFPILAASVLSGCGTQANFHMDRCDNGFDGSYHCAGKSTPAGSAEVRINPGSKVVSVFWNEPNDPLRMIISDCSYVDAQNWECVRHINSTATQTWALSGGVLYYEDEDPSIGWVRVASGTPFNGLDQLATDYGIN